MKLLSLVSCEVRKVYKSSVFWVIITAFTLLPFLSLIKLTGGADISWESYLAEVLHTFSAILIIGFAFTTCWIFGREYTDKTINDLLVKPVSKFKIALSKFITILLWNVLLTVLMYAVVVLVGAYVGLTEGTASIIFHSFFVFMAASLLTTFVSTVSAFMANITRGYLAAIGLIFLIVILVNVAENINLSPYIPWTIPGLLITDGTLAPISVFILAVTGIAGFVGTVAWWRYREQQ